MRAPRVAERALRTVNARQYVRLAADGALSVGEIPDAAFQDGLLDPAKLGASRATARAALRDDLRRLQATVAPPTAEPAAPDGASGYFAITPDDVVARPLPPDRAPPTSAPLLIADPDRPARELLEVIRACDANASLAVTADGIHLRAFAAQIEPGGLGMGGLGPMDAHAAVALIGTGTAIAIDAYAGKTARPTVFTWRGDLAGMPEALIRASASPDLTGHHDMRLWFDATFTIGAMVSALDAMSAAGANPVLIGDPANIVDPAPISTGHLGTIGGGHIGARSAGIPRIAIGQPATRGGVSAAEVRTRLAENTARLTYCYEKWLLADPALAGTIALTFTIAPSGAVTAASADGVSREVGECMAKAVRGIAFPSSRRSSDVTVSIDTAPTGG
ncbi:MAG: AgmX/PglI C-terminal domain-containing protein [Deltaproteobacteria bacterium]|nr:AgmX/PglI C-terminal domain-containing protein [Deltaproteobacteria bacterium]